MDDQNILGRFINDSKTIILELLDNDQLRIKTQIVNITIDDFSVKDCQTLGELLLNKAKSPIFLLAKLESIKNTFTSTMSNIKAIEDLDLLVKKYVGKKGKLESILRVLGNVYPHERKQIGEQCNLALEYITDKANTFKEQLKNSSI